MKKSNKTMLYVVFVLVILTIVVLGVYAFNSVGLYTASATNTTPVGTINIHAYVGDTTEIGATVTTIDQGFHDMGDVNWDGKIDGKDIAQISKCYGQPSSCCPQCDLNYDNKIDGKDIAVASKNYGRLASYYTAPFMAVVKVGNLKLIASWQGQTQTQWNTIYGGTDNLINLYFTIPTVAKDYIVTFNAMGSIGNTSAGVFNVNAQTTSLAVGSASALPDGTTFGLISIDTSGVVTTSKIYLKSTAFGITIDYREDTLSLYQTKTIGIKVPV